MTMKILRVFARRTKATPDDDLVRIGPPDRFDPPEGIDEVHISVTFTRDLAHAERLRDAWKKIHPHVLVGGPACGDPGGDFIPGRYLKPGNLITTRGCPHNCWFCFTHKREGFLRTLPIHDGHIIHDSNILAAPRQHFEAVCQMLETQTKRAVFAGGLDMRLFNEDHASRIARIKPKVDRMYFAFDADDHTRKKLLFKTGRICREYGFTRAHHLYCYVLMGYEGDAPEAAEARCRYVWNAGFTPYPMPYIDEYGSRPLTEYYRIARRFGRPAICRKLLTETERVK